MRKIAVSEYSSGLSIEAREEVLSWVRWMWENIKQWVCHFFLLSEAREKREKFSVIFWRKIKENIDDLFIRVLLALIATMVFGGVLWSAIKISSLLN